MIILTIKRVANSMTQNKFYLCLLLLSNCFTFLIGARTAEWLSYKKGDFLFDFTVDNKSETFYVKNAEFLSGNSMDQWLYVQGTWDFNTHTRFGDKIKSKLTLRNKGKWGNTQSIWTTKNQLQVVDFFIDDHSHSFNRLVPWFRKAWVKVSLNDAFDIKTDRKHYLKFGAFPYDVGRGISLGSAYAVTPGVLGFFTDNSIDQYAFGALFRGDLSKDNKITYDFYGAILENLSGTFSQTTEKVNRKCLNCPSIYRGFGDLNLLFASRLFFTFFDNLKFGKLTLEPYVVYDWVPAQKIENRSDANVKLGTMGVAIEYTGSKYEFGVETAFNYGRQFVKAWDRNAIHPHRNATTAAIEEVYNNVFVGERDATGSNRAQVTDANKAIVDNALKGVRFNDLEIGSTGLFNGPYRFRPSYSNKFAGHMLVADCAYWFKPDVLRVALTCGYSSGDENPNIVLDDPTATERDTVYGGFIGLQEIYSGKRVRSVFVIGGQRITRPLSAPELEIIKERQQFAVSVEGFSNLVYIGTGLQWTPDSYSRKIRVNPNLLYYWQEKESKKYCLALLGSETSESLDGDASKRLGLEANIFLEVNWLDNFKGFLAAAIFVPGQHFDDIIGKPTNSAQFTEVDRDDRYCVDFNQYPLVGNRSAYVLNFGFEYSF